jgi:hypothetical protein
VRLPQRKVIPFQAPTKPAPPPPRITAVLFDPATGRIKQTLTAAETHVAATAKTLGLSYLAAPDATSSHDVTHQVTAAAVTPRDPAVIAAERAANAVRKLRVKRDALLVSTVDCYNGPRWSAMSAADQVKVQAYRQALLDMPQTAKDPANPVWPVLDL